MYTPNLLLTLTLITFSSGTLSDDVTVTADSQLENRIARHIQQIDLQLKSLNYLLDTYYKDYNYTEADAHEYVSNPINTYMLIKRTSMEWPNVKMVVFNETMDQEFEEIVKLLKDKDQQQPEIVNKN